MSESKSFWDHPIEKLEQALSLRKQIASLQETLSNLFSENPPSLAAKPARTTSSGKRSMSAEARERIAAAQRARWAKSKGTTTALPKTAAKAAAAPKKKGLTPEGRAKLAAAMKARWATHKKGAPALNASSKLPVAAKPAKKAKRNISPEARAKMAEAAKKRWAKVKG